MTLMLVDGTNVVMRWASAMLPDIHKDDDAELNDKVLASVARALWQCADLVKATHMVTALDSSVGSWRRDIFPEYKVKRTANTNVWSNRLSIYLNGEGLYTQREAGFEADDIIATLAARAVRVGKSVVILSGDSDLLQLAGPNVSCYQFGKDPEPRFVQRNAAWIKEKYGIASVVHLPAYKALVGEPGDGLPGVPGIGPVKAKKLLEKYSLSDLATAPEIDSDAFKRALHLVTLREDVPIPPIDPRECRIATVAKK